ncbi:MAG TPA: hypothetical protein VLK34_09775 [Nocardioidaceae bacterium]|nr:hypothetical protein [Nocardioidaceae bacterium]
MPEPAALQRLLAPYSGAVPSPRQRDDTDEIHDNPADHPSWCAVRHEAGSRHIGQEETWRPNGDQDSRLSLRLISSGVVDNSNGLVKLGVVDESLDGAPRAADIDLTASDVRELMRRLESAVQAGS